YRVRNRRSRRVNHRNQTQKAQTVQWEVAFIRVKRVSRGIFVDGKFVVTEPYHSLSQASQFQVGCVELFAQLAVYVMLLSIRVDSGIPELDPLDESQV